MLKQLTQAQKKIIIQGSIIMLVFVVVWLFIFLPQSATIAKTKTELNSTEVQIQDIEQRISKNKSLAQGIALMEARQKLLDKKFPKQEEESFKILSESAKKLNIKIISLKPSLKKPILDENNAEVKVGGKSCQVMGVSLALQSSYADLIKYRQMMEEDLPGFVTIEKLVINKDSLSMAGNLVVTLDFNLYFLD